MKELRSSKLPNMKLSGTQFKKCLNVCLQSLRQCMLHLNTCKYS